MYMLLSGKDPKEMIIFMMTRISTDPTNTTLQTMTFASLQIIVPSHNLMIFSKEALFL